MDFETAAYDSDEEFEHIYDSEYSISEDGLGTSSTGRWMGSLTSLRSTTFGSEKAKLSSNVSVCSKAEKEEKVGHDDTGDFEIIDVSFLQNDEKQEGLCSKDEANSDRRSNELLLAQAKALREKDFIAGSVPKPDSKSSKPVWKHDTSTSIDEEFVADIRKRHDISTSVDEDVLSEQQETLEKNDTKETLQFDCENGTTEAYVYIKDVEVRLLQDNVNESNKLCSEGDLHLLMPLQMESLTFEEHLVEDNVKTNVNKAGGKEDRLVSEEFIKSTEVADEEIVAKEESLVENSGNCEIMTCLKQNAEGSPIENCKENQPKHTSKAKRHSIDIKSIQQGLKDTEQEFHLLKPLTMEALVLSEHFDVNANDIKENDSIFQDDDAITEAYTDNSETHDDLVALEKKSPTEFIGNDGNETNCDKDSVVKICSGNKLANVAITEQLPMIDKLMEQEPSGIEQDVRLLEPFITNALLLNEHSSASASDINVKGKIVHEEKNITEACVESSEAEEVIALGRKCFMESTGNEENEENYDKDPVVKICQKNEPESVAIPEGHPETESSMEKEFDDIEREWHHLEPLEMEALILNEHFDVKTSCINVKDEMVQEKGAINEACIDSIEKQKEFHVWCRESFPEPSDMERNEIENDKGSVMKVYHENEPETVATIEQTSANERSVERGVSETEKELQLFEPIELGATVLEENFIENQRENECMTTVDGISNHETSMDVEKFIDCTQGLDEETAWNEEKLADGSKNNDYDENDWKQSFESFGIQMYEANEPEVMDVAESNPHFEDSNERRRVQVNQHLHLLEPMKMEVLILEEHSLDNFDETSVEKASNEHKSMAIEAFIGNTKRLDEEISGWQESLMDIDEMIESKTIENKHFLDQEISNDISKTDNRGEQMTYEITCHAERELFEAESMIEAERVEESNIEEHETEVFKERGLCTDFIEESGHVQGEAIKEIKIKLSMQTEESCTENATDHKPFIENEEKMLENVVNDGDKNKRSHENLLAVEEDFNAETSPHTEESSAETANDDKPFIENEEEMLENVFADGDNNKRPHENLVAVEEEDFNAENSPQTDESPAETAIDDKPFIGNEDEMPENVISDRDENKRPDENLVTVEEEEDVHAEISPQSEESSIETAIDDKPHFGNEEELLENVVADGDKNKRPHDNLVAVEEEEDVHAEISPQTEEFFIEAAIDDKPFIGNEEELLENVADGDENKRPDENLLTVEEEDFNTEISPQTEESSIEAATGDKLFIENADGDENKRPHENFVAVEEEEDFHAETSPQTEGTFIEAAIGDRSFVGNEEELLENVILDIDEGKRPDENLITVEEEEDFHAEILPQTERSSIEAATGDKLFIENEGEMLRNVAADGDENKRPHENFVAVDEEEYCGTELSPQTEESSIEAATGDKPFIENEDQMLENVAADGDENKRPHENFVAVEEEEDFHVEISPQTEGSFIEAAIGDKSFVGNEEELLENVILDRDEGKGPDENLITVEEEEDFHAEILPQTEGSSIEAAIGDKLFIENEDEMLGNVAADGDENKRPHENFMAVDEEENCDTELSPQTEDSSTENAIDDKPQFGNEEELLENVVADGDKNKRPHENLVAVEADDFNAEILLQTEESFIEAAIGDKLFTENEDEMLENVILDRDENKGPDENPVSAEKEDGFHAEISTQAEESSNEIVSDDKPFIENEEEMLEKFVRKVEKKRIDDNIVAAEEDGFHSEILPQTEEYCIDTVTDGKPCTEIEEEIMENVVVDRNESNEPDENPVAMEENEEEEASSGEIMQQKEESDIECAIDAEPFVENKREMQEKIVSEKVENKRPHENLVAREEKGEEGLHNERSSQKEGSYCETASDDKPFIENEDGMFENVAADEDENKRQHENAVTEGEEEDFHAEILPQIERSSTEAAIGDKQFIGNEDEMFENVTNDGDENKRLDENPVFTEEEEGSLPKISTRAEESSTETPSDDRPFIENEEGMLENIITEEFEERKGDNPAKEEVDFHLLRLAEKEEFCIDIVSDLGQNPKKGDKDSASAKNEDKQIKSEVFNDAATKEDLKKVIFAEKEESSIGTTSDFVQSAAEEDEFSESVNYGQKHTRKEFACNSETERDMQKTIVAENIEPSIAATVDFEQSAKEGGAVFANEHKEVKNELLETGRDMQKTIVAENIEPSIAATVDFEQSAKEGGAVFANEHKEVKNELLETGRDMHKTIVAENIEPSIAATVDFEQSAKEGGAVFANEHKEVKNELLETGRDMHKTIVAENIEPSIAATVDFEQSAKEGGAVFANEHKEVKNELLETGRDMHKTIVAENIESSIAATVDFEQSAKEGGAVFANEHKEVKNELLETGRDMQKTIVAENIESSIAATVDFEQSAKEGGAVFANEHKEVKNELSETRRDMQKTIVAENKESSKSETKEDLNEVTLVEEEELNAQIAVEFAQSGIEENSVFANVSNRDAYTSGVTQDLNDKMLIEKEESGIETTDDLEQQIKDDKSNEGVKFSGRSYQGLENVNSFKMQEGAVADKRFDENEALSNGIAKQTMQEDYCSKVREKIKKHANEGLVDRKLHGEFYHEQQEPFHDEIRNVWISNGKGVQSTVYDAYSCQSKIEGTSTFDNELDLKREEAHVVTSDVNSLRGTSLELEKRHENIPKDRGNKREERIPSFVTWERKSVKRVSSNEVQSWKDKGANMNNNDLGPEGGKVSEMESEEHNKANSKENEQQVERIANSLAEDESAVILRLLKEDLVWKTEDELSDYIVLGSPVEDKQSNTTNKGDLDIENKIDNFVMENERPSSDPFHIEDEHISVTKSKSSGIKALNKEATELAAKENERKTEDYKITKSVAENKQREKSSEYEEKIVNKVEDNISNDDDESLVYIDMNSVRTTESEKTGQNIESGSGQGKLAYAASKESYEDQSTEQEEFVYHVERSVCKEENDNVEDIVMGTPVKVYLEAEKGKGETGEESRETERENTAAEIDKDKKIPMLRTGQQHASKNMSAADDSLAVIKANPSDSARHVINSSNIGAGATNDIKIDSRDSKSHSFACASSDVAIDNGNKEIDLVESERREMIRQVSSANELPENLTGDKGGNNDTNISGEEPCTEKEAAEDTSVISEGMGLINNDVSLIETEGESHQEKKEAVYLRTEEEVDELVKEDQKRQSRSLYEIGKDLLVKIFGGGDPGVIAPSTETSSGRTFDVGQSGYDDVQEEEFQTEIMAGKEDVDMSADFEQRVGDEDMISEGTSKEENERQSEVNLAKEEMVEEKEVLSVEATVCFEQRHGKKSDLLQRTMKEEEKDEGKCYSVEGEGRFLKETVIEKESLGVVNAADFKQQLDEEGSVLQRASTEEEAGGKCNHVEAEEEFNEEMVTQKKNLGMEATADSEKTVRVENKVITDASMEEHEVKEEQIQNVEVENDLHLEENFSLGFSTEFDKGIEMEEKVLEETNMEGDKVNKDQVTQVEVEKDLRSEMIDRKEEDISLEVTAESDKVNEQGNKVLQSTSKREQQGNDETDLEEFADDFSEDKIADVEAAAEVYKFAIEEDKVLLLTDNQAIFDIKIEDACHGERQEGTEIVKGQGRIGVDLEQSVEIETDLSDKADLNKNDDRREEDDSLDKEEDLHTEAFPPEQDTSLELCGEDKSTKTSAEQHAIMSKVVNTGSDIDMGEKNLLIMKENYRFEAIENVEKYREAVGIRAHLKQSVEMMADVPGKADLNTNDDRSEGVDLVGKGEDLHRGAFATEQELSLEKCNEDQSTTKTFAQQYASMSKEKCNGYDEYMSKETLRELVAKTEPCLEATHDVGGHSKVEGEKVKSSEEERNETMSEDCEIVVTEDDKDVVILVENENALKFEQIAKIEERLMVNKVTDENNNVSDEIRSVSEEKDDSYAIFVDKEEKEVVLKCNKSSSSPLSKDQEIIDILNDKGKPWEAVVIRQVKETNGNCKNYAERQVTSHSNKRTVSISGENEINIRTKNICSNLQSLFFQVGSKAPEIAEMSRKWESSKQSGSRPNSAESTQTSCSQRSEIADKHLSHNVLNDFNNKATIMKQPTLEELGNDKEDSTVSSRKSLDIELSSPSYATTVGKNLSLCFFDRHKQCFEEERHFEVSDATGKDAAGNESCLDSREGQVLNDGEGNGCISNVNAILKKECAGEEGQEYSTTIRDGVQRTKDAIKQESIITEQSGSLFPQPKRLFREEKSVQRTDLAIEVAHTGVKAGSAGISGTVKETDQIAINVKAQPYSRNSNKATEIGSIAVGK